MRLGTSSIVVAAFIGPGTVLTCASAGLQFGYALGWVLIFSTLAVFVLQSFTASTGILAGLGLGEAIRHTVTQPILRPLVNLLVVLGLWLGCAAFEMGNLLGAASGVAALAGGPEDLRVLVVVLGLAAGALLLLDLKILVRIFTALVALMSLLFIAAMALAPIDWGAALRGLLVPEVPADSLLTVIALIGTTVVTYNLFLHASACKQYWRVEPDTRVAWRRELGGMAVFLPIGGLISFAILGVGATLGADTGTVTGVGMFAALLEPVAGNAARLFFGLGLFSAGLTSAMTAPLAAASGIRELFGWPADPKGLRSRLVWGSVVLAGLGFAVFQISPLRAIIVAQAANGLLLPLIAGLMLVVSLRQRSMRLPLWYRLLGAAIVLVCAGLGFRTLVWVWGQVG